MVLDIDPRHGGEKTLALLEQMHPALPMTWQVQTSRGGMHIYLRVPTGYSVQSGKPMTGIDLLGTGANVLAPGSTHPDGTVYTWMDCYSPADVALAEAPAWLFEHLTGDVWDPRAKRKVRKPLWSYQHTCKPSAKKTISEATLCAAPSTREKLGSSGVFLLATPSTPLLEETGSPAQLDGPTVKALFKRWDVVRQCLPLLGIPADIKPGKKFRCVLGHKDHHPSANLFRAADGSFHYVDFHHGADEPLTLSLPEVYFRRCAGHANPGRMPRPAYVTWSIRLLVDAGIHPAHEVMGPKAHGLLSPDERTCYEGFKKLLSVKWLCDAKAPSPYTHGFCASWTGTTERCAERSIKGLLSKGYIRMVGHDSKGVSLFVLGSRSLIQRRRRRQHFLKQRQATIEADVQKDVDAMLDENAKPRATRQCQRGVDTRTPCIDCDIETAQRRLEERRRPAGVRIAQRDLYGLVAPG